MVIVLGLEPDEEDRVMTEAAEFIPACVIEIAAYWRKRRPTLPRAQASPSRCPSKPISPAAMTRARVAPGASTRSAAAACTKPPGDRRGASFIPAASPRSTTEAGGLEALGLDPTLLPKALAIRDWLLTEAAQLADPGQISPGLAERLNALGVPIDRIMTRSTSCTPSTPAWGASGPRKRARPLACSRMAPTAIGLQREPVCPRSPHPGMAAARPRLKPLTTGSTSSRT